MLRGGGRWGSRVRRRPVSAVGREGRRMVLNGSGGGLGLVAGLPNRGMRAREKGAGWREREVDG